MKGHARQLMIGTVEVASPTTTVAEAARQLARFDISALPVVEEGGAITGIVTEIDIAAALLQAIPLDTSLHTIMKSPVVTVDEFAPTDTVIRLMQEKGVHHLPVTRQGVVVGLITPQEIIKYFVEHQLPSSPDAA